ncbi:hypothetical protein F53441_9514 [Fusarium austroafricanum]|uniref:Uncharacterized protein n=1 Tax=Fusarium austroafricanum TaxID=2364996 RepID=A0A8H4NVF3_9HYPO|nr:hypothetical protein F53441_9514 [Fusarium austroafricanum]
MEDPNIQQLHVEATTDIEQQISLILTSYLSESPLPTALEAAIQINDLFPHQHEKSEVKRNPGGFLAAFWDLAFNIAVQLGYQTQPMRKFISLIKALRDLPSTVILEDGRRLWQDLPDLALFFTERWHQMCIPNPDITPETSRRWKNVNGLAVYLTVENLYGGWYRALESIQLGLENGSRREAQNITECYAPAAAIWLSLLSQEIYHRCKENALQDSNSKGQLWKGKPGYNLQRWAFWRSRLAELRDSPLMTNESREIFSEAEAAMEAAME